MFQGTQQPGDSRAMRKPLHSISTRDAFESIGLGVFFSWLWSVTQNPTVPSVQHYSEGVYFSHWTLILASSTLTIAAMIAAREIRHRRSRLPWLPHGKAVLLSAYALITYFPMLAGMTDSIHHPAATVIAGALAAWAFIAWGTHLGPRGPRHLVGVSVSALGLAFAFAIAINVFPSRTAALLTSFAPLVSIGILMHSSPSEHPPRTPESSQASLLPRISSFKFFATLFVQGMAFGLLHYLYGTVVFEKCNDPYCPLRHLQPLFPISVEDFYGFASIAGLALAGVIVLIAIKALRLNFRKLLYVVGFPLAALGFLIIGFDDGLKGAASVSHASGLNFVYGEIVFVAGYYYLVAISWMLCAHLARIGKERNEAAYAWSSLSLIAGQLIGFATSALTASMQMSRSNLCFVALFALMFASLLIATNDSLWSDWGSVRPDDIDRASIFKRACKSIEGTYALTPRESEIFALLARGRNMNHIAESLVISKDTVKTHCRSIYRKLQVHSQQEVIDLVEAEISVSRDQRTH